MAYVIWAHKRFTECYPTCKKAGLCAVMSMWLVNIKEHVWSIGTCPTTILLSAMGECVSECCTERLKIGILPHMRWWTCMLPRELILDGVAPPQENGMTQYAKSGIMVTFHGALYQVCITLHYIWQQGTSSSIMHIILTMHNYLWKVSCAITHKESL